MALFALIKTVMLWSACGLIGMYLGKWHGKRANIPVTVHDITENGGFTFEGGVTFSVPKGDTIKYLLIDHTKGVGNFTANPRKASLARVMGKDVMVFAFKRDELKTVLATASASHPENSFNFLKQKFVTGTPPKDLHVQVF